MNELLKVFAETLSSSTIGSIIAASTLAVALLMTFIEISPIKIDPWKWILKRIGKIMNEDTEKRITAIDDKVVSLQMDIRTFEDSVDEQHIKDVRTRILRFGDEIRLGVSHSQEHYDQILEDISEYTKYCSDHPEFQNNKTVTTTKIINETYEKLLKNNNFLN